MRRTSLFMSIEVLKELQRRAARTGLTPSALIRLMVEKQLREEITIAK